MPMSPRLLRPRALGGFSPKNLSGLAGWWDAGAASSLFQASNGTTAVTAADNPVGYWGDLSGNGRNMTQSTDSNRPLYKPGTLNGRPVLDFDGSNDTLAAAFTLTQPVTIFLAAQYKTNNANQGTLLDGGGGTGNTMRWFLPSNTTFGMFAGAQIQTNPLTVAGWNVFEAVFNGSSSSMVRNGTTIASGNVGTATPGGLRLAVFGNGFSNPGDVQVAEVVLYSRVLSPNEASSVRQYLTNKWGIGRPPTVSNADAQSWINNVYINGGTVSTSTAAAVNTFCNAIDAAGIRDRFYRLNLFAGTSLNAALVPLYRGPSLGGAQLGGATDINNNFVSGDYAETGASRGLKGNQSNKFLNTSLAPSSLPSFANHISVYAPFQNATHAFRALIGASETLNTRQASLYQWITAGEYNYIAGANNSIKLAASATPPPTFLLGSVDGSAAAILALDGAVTTGTLSTYSASTQPWYVFGESRAGTLANATDARISAYSIGLPMTSSQAASLRSALIAMNSAMGL